MWLENHLKSLNRVIICVSHDRTFLGNFTNKVLFAIILYYLTFPALMHRMKMFISKE